MGVTIYECTVCGHSRYDKTSVCPVCGSPGFLVKDGEAQNMLFRVYELRWSHEYFKGRVMSR